MPPASALDASKWSVHDDAFLQILGDSPTLENLLTVEEYPFAHEAGVFFASKNELFITSSPYASDEGIKKVMVSKISLGDSTVTTQEEIGCDQIAMGNGGVNDGDDHILFCAQGSLTKPSGLFRMLARPPYTTTPVVTSFYGRPFNSVNDVVFSEDGCIWFTDPCYGFEQGYRPKPALPSQVYRFHPKNQSIRAVADGFGHPNGLCFSPDEKTLYVTDTDFQHGDGGQNLARASTIYAFDVTTRHGQPFLTNRRLFAFADVGIPDGIKCDMEGNVYSGCGDGVNVWSAGGELIGRILVPGGAANFCFGQPGEMFILNEHRLWRARFNPGVQGALLKLSLKSHL